MQNRTDFGKAILDKFPDIGDIVGIESNPESKSSFISRASTKMGCEFTHIERREILRNFEGRMTAVVSAHVFLVKMEEAFQNMFHLLKPEGEAAVLFLVKSLIDDGLKEILKKPKWKDAYMGFYVEDLHQKGEDEYKEMVERIGFSVIDCEEK